ncbi:MAG: hypothetical protein ABIH68_06160 [bacterium]
MLKKFLIISGLILSAAFNCFAASSGTITLTVTVAPSIDIEVWYLDSGADTDVYDFGTLDVNKTTITVASITVKNSSDGLVEDWYIRASDAQCVGTNWTLASSTGTNQYELEALLSGDDQPAPSSFDGENLTTANQAMDVSNFADGENGENVSPGSTRGLWFKISTPSEVSNSSEKTIWVTIVATQAG